MKVNAKVGYMQLDSGKKGPLYIAPHAFLAFQKPGDHQDHNTHFVAYKLAKKNGKALISTMTRERDLGIDFYRLPPPRDVAIKADKHFRDHNVPEMKKFRKVYSWTAKDFYEHGLKKAIYDDFWHVAKDSKTPLIFVHRQFFNPIRHPSLIDVTPLENFELSSKAVDFANEKYKLVFKKLLPIYVKAFEFKSECILFKDIIENDCKLDIFRGKKPNIQKRLLKFNEVLKKQPYLEVTHMLNFKGKYLKLIMDRYKIRNKQIIQFEISEFLTRRFPGIAIHVIDSILKKMKYK